MTVDFTENEKEWIIIKPFKWSIKKDCPKKLKEKISEKLDLLYDRPYGIGEKNNGRNS